VICQRSITKEPQIQHVLCLASHGSATRHLAMFLVKLCTRHATTHTAAAMPCHNATPTHSEAPVHQRRSCTAVLHQSAQRGCWCCHLHQWQLPQPLQLLLPAAGPGTSTAARLGPGRWAQGCCLHAQGWRACKVSGGSRCVSSPGPNRRMLASTSHWCRCERQSCLATEQAVPQGATSR
jgi:hypothetical protein